ncbi:MAG TPA: carbohydrate kinase [Thermoanaerobacterales bacterium]|nr:carbohydrate kinase [Thermoanaerobacterales bacterium]
MGKYLVGIDEGTTGCKTCIFDLEGNLIGSDYREYPCYYPKPGWVEQLAEELTPALFESCKAAIAKAGIDPKDIIAVGLSSQGSVVGPVDKDGKLLRPFIGWQDLRGEKELKEVEEKIPLDEYYQITGYPLGLMFSITKLLWLRNNEPDIFEKTAVFTTNQDYFLREFGADGYFTDISSASRDGLCDVDNHVWSKRVFDALGLDMSKHPKIVDSGQPVGRIPKSVAEKTGLAEGTLLCVGAHDQNCSTFGCGAVEGGTAAMVVGTFGSCFVVSDKPIRDPNRVLVVKGNAGPKNWTIEAFAAAAASSYRWYRDTFGGVEAAAAKLLNDDPYNLINKQIETVPPGANGITFLPYLQGANVPRPNGNARGAFIGMTLGTTKAEMARAVMEGICYEMKTILDAQKRAGVHVSGIRLTGGGSKSPMWCQMQADIYQVPIYRLQTHETGTLGAALYAGVGAGVYKDFKEAVETAVHIKDSFEPNPKVAEAYNEAYQRYVNAYTALEKGGVF